jgi:prepilin-type N-terminal cleavage/methylation domain-containing protein
MHSRTPTPPGPARGFTLVELIITMAVVAILASLSGYAYEQHRTQDRRMEAVERLQTLQRELNECMADGTPLANCTDDLDTDDGDHYGFRVTTDNGRWTITASPLSGGAQGGDGPLSLDSLGRRTGPWPG